MAVIEKKVVNSGEKRVVRKRKPATKKRTYTKRIGTRAGNPKFKLVGYGDYYTAPAEAKESFGGNIGAFLGHGIQQAVKSLIGFGDYHVNENSIMNGAILSGDPPTVRNSSNGFIVRHREYIGDIYASTAFAINQYSINPGLITTFPWLSQICDSFEQYRFRGLVFEYKSMSSDALFSSNASSALGTVIMSTQYNALDQPFVDKRTMENYEYANSSKPSCSMMHPVECKMSQTSVAELYVRTAVPNTGDLRMYDLGTFSIAVQGMQNTSANTVIGELWATFELELLKPKLLIGGDALLSDHFAGSGTNVFTAAAPFGIQSSLALRSGSNLGCSIQVAAVAPYGANAVIWPAFVVDGIYMVQYIMEGTATTASSPSFAYGATLVNVDVTSSAVKLLNGNSQSEVWSPSTGAATTNSLQVTMIVKILQTTPGTAASISITFPAGSFPTGAGSCDVIVSQLDATFN